MVADPEALARITERIARDRPAAIAGPVEFWARLVGLSPEETATALETLAARGVVRRQPLGAQRFYIADPPHGGHGGGERN